MVMQGQDVASKLDVLAGKLDKIAALLAYASTNPLLDLFEAAYDISDVAVGGNSSSKYAQVKDLWGRTRLFSHLRISQIEIYAPKLAVADSLDLRIYRAGQANNQDLVADFSGTSQLTDTWYASFSNRQIDYKPQDLTAGGILWIVISNLAGNSNSSPFLVKITGQIFPVYPPDFDPIALAQLSQLQKASG